MCGRGRATRGPKLIVFGVGLIFLVDLICDKPYQSASIAHSAVIGYIGAHMQPLVDPT